MTFSEYTYSLKISESTHIPQLVKRILESTELFREHTYSLITHINCHIYMLTEDTYSDGEVEEVTGGDRFHGGK